MATYAEELAVAMDAIRGAADNHDLWWQGYEEPVLSEPERVAFLREAADAVIAVIDQMHPERPL